MTQEVVVDGGSGEDGMGWGRVCVLEIHINECVVYSIILYHHLLLLSVAGTQFCHLFVRGLWLWPMCFGQVKERIVRVMDG